MELGDHLFRHESGRMVAALTRVLGVHNLALAEDVVQDAFCRALEVWPFRGVPDNPSAWLMTTAKRRALDILRRERTARQFEPEVAWLAESEWTLAPAVHEWFSADAIKDDQLRMMFSCCHPRLPEEAQVALVLHILCGFSVNEIASAFVTTHAAMEKRITRAKKVLAGSKRLFDLAEGADFAKRLPAVQRALYLLFNEGYHGASPESAIRSELCHEAMRLTAHLFEHPLAAVPTTYALAALMCLHVARLPARVDAHGALLPLVDQDRSLWDAKRIAEGQLLLERAATGTSLSEYHIEAAIAWMHTSVRDAAETDWAGIVSLYDTLLTVRPSPIVALNRAIAVAHAESPARGLDAIANIPDADRLATYPFYHAALAELEWRRGQYAVAHDHFHRASTLARNAMERHFLEDRMRACHADHARRS